MGKISLILRWAKKRWLLLSILVVIIIILLFSLGGNSSIVTTAKVEKGLVVSEVSVTGTVKPSQSLNLGFVQGGRIAKIYVNVGDSVYQKQTLVSLENNDLAAQFAEANASISIQQAKLDQLVRGTRPESLKVTESDLAKANVDLESYYSNTINVLNDAYAKSYDAVKNQIGAFFTDDNTDNPRLTFSSGNSQAATDAQRYRVSARDELVAWQSELQSLGISSSRSNLDNVLLSSQNHITIIRNLFNSLADALQDAFSLSLATSETYKTDLNTARTNINTAATNITGQQQSILSQKALVQKTQDQYNLLLTGSDPEDINAQQAQVDQAKANALYIKAQYDKTVLTAPFAGVVTKVPFVEGDIILANVSAVSLRGSGKYQIEANVAESDIAKITIGQSASVDLDAYGKAVVFEAKVINIDLSATIIEGVATYKTTLEFDKDDSRILPGLTANVDIMAGKKDNVLFVPTRNLIRTDSTYHVKLITNQNNGETKDVDVKIGLRGSDGRTEIISGLSEGDLIVAE
jgi:HlyD family secretion protein